MPKPKSTARLWKGAKRANQRYRAPRTITLQGGAKKRIYGYGATKAAAEADLERKIAIEQAKAPSPQTITVQGVAVRWLTHRKRSGTKGKTLYNNSQHLKSHILPHIGDKAIWNVTLDELEAIQNRLVKKGHYRTAALVTIDLRGLFAHARRLYRHEIARGEVGWLNPAELLENSKEPPKPGKRQAKMWTSTQLNVFLSASKKLYERNQSLMYAYWRCAVFTGLRRGELFNLRWEAVQARGGKHVVEVNTQYVYYDGRHHEETPKSVSGFREVPISSSLYAFLQAHDEKLNGFREAPNWQEHKLVLPSEAGTPIEPRNLYRSYYGLVDTLELPRISPHQLRKVYATHVARRLVEAGKNPIATVQYLLGHSKPDVALEIYVQVTQEDLNVAALEFDELEVEMEGLEDAA